MSENKNKPMYLYTGEYQGHPTFYALAASKDAPFTHLIYDPIRKGLAVVGTFLKHGFVYEDKLDSNGIPEEVSGQKANHFRKQNPNFPPFKRVRLDSQVNNEYYVADPVEQEALIERFCENASSFDYKKYIEAPAVIPAPNQMELIPQGQPEELKV